MKADSGVSMGIERARQRRAYEAELAGTDDSTHRLLLMQDQERREQQYKHDALKQYFFLLYNTILYYTILYFFTSLIFIIYLILSYFIYYYYIMFYIYIYCVASGCTKRGWSTCRPGLGAERMRGRESESEGLMLSSTAATVPRRLPLTNYKKTTSKVGTILFIKYPPCFHLI